MFSRISQKDSICDGEVGLPLCREEQVAIMKKGAVCPLIVSCFYMAWSNILRLQESTPYLVDSGGVVVRSESIESREGVVSTL
jgi:hypothetical protein